MIFIYLLVILIKAQLSKLLSSQRTSLNYGNKSCKDNTIAKTKQKEIPKASQYNKNNIIFERIFNDISSIKALKEKYLLI